MIHVIYLDVAGLDASDAFFFGSESECVDYIKNLSFEHQQGLMVADIHYFLKRVREASYDRGHTDGYWERDREISRENA